VGILLPYLLWLGQENFGKVSEKFLENIFGVEKF